MVHIVHGASMTINCYAGDRMRPVDDRKRGYDQMIEGRTGGVADAPAGCFYVTPGGCHLRNRDEGGAA
jgi:hypothetical protein